MGFQAYKILVPSLGREVKVGLAICMDIQWKDFAEGQEKNFELANF